MDALEAARALAGPVGHLGGRFMMAPETFTRGAELGFEPGLAYYLGGRLGVLGDAPVDVVAASAVFIDATMLGGAWEQVRATAAPATIAAHYADGCSIWAEATLGDLAELADVRRLGGAVVAAATPALAPLFAGWRSLGVPDSDTAGGYRILHLLRELRFSRHAVAAQAQGLTPLETILAGPGGEGGAKMFGWPEPFPEMSDELRARRATAEDVTDQLDARDLSVLSDGERDRLVAAVQAVGAALS